MWPGTVASWPLQGRPAVVGNPPQAHEIAGEDVEALQPRRPEEPAEIEVALFGGGVGHDVQAVVVGHGAAVLDVDEELLVGGEQQATEGIGAVGGKDGRGQRAGERAVAAEDLEGVGGGRPIIEDLGLGDPAAGARRHRERLLTGRADEAGLDLRGRDALGIEGARIDPPVAPQDLVAAQRVLVRRRRQPREPQLLQIIRRRVRLEAVEERLRVHQHPGIAVDAAQDGEALAVAEGHQRSSGRRRCRPHEPDVGREGIEGEAAAGEKDEPAHH
jgi:hypothetical protein